MECIMAGVAQACFAQPQGIFCLALTLHGQGQAGGAFAHQQGRGGGLRQMGQGLALRRGELAGLLVQHAQGAQCFAAGQGQRGARIKPDEGLARDQRVLAEARILVGIFDFQDAIARERMGAKRHVAVCLAHVHTHA